ncbi:MAG: hypothetical protein VB031_02750 [Eubacteriaceae bacterium]|nr:hypothetical protein [Eubacteriaceae bacterium]
MIFGMPAVSFFSFLSWPVIYIVLAFVVYGIMKKQDAKVDDTEFEQSVKGRKGREQQQGGASK